MIYKALTKRNITVEQHFARNLLPGVRQPAKTHTYITW